MEPRHCDLWRQIQAFELDDSDAVYPFSARLAKENGWSRQYARRVIDQYKRFVFLCLTADHVVCPSEQVDQAWHLHLTYTRSYWDELCRGVLGRPLHHTPTQGGLDEHHKHVRLYERTLASYGEQFGDDPPSDIWPPAAVRFGNDTHQRRVNMRHHWVIPKWPLGVWKSTRRWGLAGAVLLPIVVASLNPFDLRGPEFLMLFACSYVVTLLAGIYLRRTFRQAPDAPSAKSLDPFEVACLAKNERAATDAAICQLHAAGLLELVKESNKILSLPVATNYRFVARGALTKTTTPLEEAVHQAAYHLQGTSFARLQIAGAAEARKIQSRLETEGLLVTKERLAAARWYPAMLMFGLLAFGLVKMVVGLARDKPVGFLVTACSGTLVTALLFLIPPRRTLAGRQLLSEYRRRFANLRAQFTAGSLEPTATAMAVALFGTAVLANSPLEDLRLAWLQNYHQHHQSSSGGCGDSGCGGGGCGGCGGGGD
jgi:uncharacterized protein (TIGR04222 family)